MRSIVYLSFNYPHALPPNSSQSDSLSDTRDLTAGGSYFWCLDFLTASPSEIKGRLLSISSSRNSRNKEKRCREKQFPGPRIQCTHMHCLLMQSLFLQTTRRLGVVLPCSQMFLPASCCCSVLPVLCPSGSTGSSHTHTVIHTCCYDRRTFAAVSATAHSQPAKSAPSVFPSLLLFLILGIGTTNERTVKTTTTT